MEIVMKNKSGRIAVITSEDTSEGTIFSLYVEGMEDMRIRKNVGKNPEPIIGITVKHLLEVGFLPIEIVNRMEKLHNRLIALLCLCFGLLAALFHHLIK